MQGRPVHDQMVITVRRENLLGQTMFKLKEMQVGRGDAWKLPLNVIFEGEPG